MKATDTIVEWGRDQIVCQHKSDRLFMLPAILYESGSKHGGFMITLWLGKTYIKLQHHVSSRNYNRRYSSF